MLRFVTLSALLLVSQACAQSPDYEKLESCTLIEDRGNDGDSFTVSHDGDEFILRLYFVDTPEKYINYDLKSQAARVREQAEDLGGLSIEETIAVGKVARKYVLDLLRKKPFTVYTKWERVYNSERFYGFVEIDDPESGEKIYLSTLLVRKGLARIHTKGANTPNGHKARSHEDYLRRLRETARKNNEGAWGL